jgi:hypothetical protein
MSKTTHKTIDATPTWRGILPVYLTVIEQGGENGRRIAREELARMAEAADKWNAHAKALVDALENMAGHINTLRGDDFATVSCRGAAIKARAALAAARRENT